jgi:hypothetical protein
MLVSLAACHAAPTADSADAPAAGGPTITGHVTSDATWAGAWQLTGDVTIDPGVTVTVSPGTTLDVDPDGSIEVDGTLDATGTSAAPITIEPAQGAQYFPGIAVAMDGSATLAHVSVRGGGLYTQDRGALSFIDSELVDHLANYFVMSGGSLDVQYSNLGESGYIDHCIFHLNPGGYAIRVNHSNISGAQMALMFNGGAQADFTSNNWLANTEDVESTPGGSVTGDFSYGYFSSGTPPVAAPGNSFQLDDLATAPLIDAGPRP